MINPDAMPFWFAAPAAVIAWAAWLAPTIRDRIRARRR